MRNIAVSDNKISGSIFCKPYLDYVSKDFALDESTKLLIAENCQLVKFNKGESVLKNSEICQYVYFIVKGECISYLTDSNGKITTWFLHFNSPESTVNNIFAIDCKSFILRQPATISIETLSHVTAIRFSAGAVNKLRLQSPAVEHWMRLANERSYIHVYDRIKTLLTMSAADRYQQLLKNEPHLLNMFSSYLIASYLCMAPPSLSRIRKSIKTQEL